METPQPSESTICMIICVDNRRGWTRRRRLIGGGSESGGANDILRTRLRPLILPSGNNSTRVIINRFGGHILSIVLRRPHDQPIDPEMGQGLGRDGRKQTRFVNTGYIEFPRILIIFSKEWLWCPPFDTAFFFTKSVSMTRKVLSFLYSNPTTATTR